MNYSLVILRKLPYYLFSVLQLIKQLKNPWILFAIAVGRAGTLRFRNGLMFSVTQPIDPLILKETMIDDHYGLGELDSPRTIIDVGAAFGDFCVSAARRFPKARILAFEPNREAYILLQKNIKANNLKRITAYNYAVSTSHKLRFYIAKYNVRSSAIKDSLSRRYITAKGVRLSKYINGPVDLLKIDTEGGEEDVLASITDKQFKTILRIVCEYHNYLVDEQDRKLVKSLKAKGYNTICNSDPYYSKIGYVVAYR